MRRTFISLSAILGVVLFCGAYLLGGFLLETYDPISQYISETMAIDTPHGEALRYYGYLPSGLLLTFFGFAAPSLFPKSNWIKIGFWGIALFYSIGTVLIGFFPCDSGCNRAFINPSISQILHNLIGVMTYIFVPISILLVSMGLRQTKQYSKFATIGFICGLIGLIFNIILLSEPFSVYAGLYQRILEGSILFLDCCCGLRIASSG